MQNKLLLVLLLFALTGCNFSLERQSGEDFLITLRTLTVPAQTRPLPGALTVELPEAEATIDTRRISLRRSDGATDYYAGARWTEFLPVMVRDALTGSLVNARLTQSITTDEVPAQGPYHLSLVIEEFQAIYANSGQPPLIRIHLQARLSDQRRPHAPRLFELRGQSVALRDDLPSIALAFQQAFESVTQDAVTHLREAMGH